jgi:hypothetical protein
MEKAKTLLINILVVAAGVATWELGLKPLVEKMKPKG